MNLNFYTSAPMQAAQRFGNSSPPRSKKSSESEGDRGIKRIYFEPENIYSRDLERTTFRKADGKPTYNSVKNLLLSLDGYNWQPAQYDKKILQATAPDGNTVVSIQPPSFSFNSTKVSAHATGNPQQKVDIPQVVIDTLGEINRHRLNVNKYKN